MRVYVRQDLIDDEDYPSCSECITREEWEMLTFTILETREGMVSHEDGFNMIILHPITKKELYVCSLDFNFCD